MTDFGDYPRVSHHGLPRLGSDPLTVACVYRSGGKHYSPRYVEVLHAMVERNLTVPHRFVCLTDVADVLCERIPLIAGWPGFFSKIELFRPNLFAGPVLYVDLDTVIHGNIDRLARPAREVAFGCVSDPRGGHMNSSVMLFTVDCSFIYERFMRSRLFFEIHVRPHIWFTLRRVGISWLANVGSSYGDQGFSEMCMTERGVNITYLDRELPDMFSVFGYTANADVEPRGGICLMMGRPKPHEIRSGWIARNWR